MQIKSTLVSRLENNKVPVLVRRRKDKTLLQVVEVPCKSIGTDEDRKNFQWSKSEPGTVHITSSGICKAVYGVEQVVQIETRALWLSDDLSTSMRALGVAGIKDDASPTGVVIEDVTDHPNERTPLSLHP